MKKMWGTRVLAMLLVLALTAGLVPAALAANSETAVAFKQVPNDTLDTLIRPDVAVGEIEDAEMGEDTAAYQAHDLVRVSIILEDTSTLEAYSDAAAEGTLAEDAAAVSYRAALQRKQDSVVRKISSTILGREDLDVVWNLTLVANLISANVEYGKIEQIERGFIGFDGFLCARCVLLKRVFIRAIVKRLVRRIQARIDNGDPHSGPCIAGRPCRGRAGHAG